MPLGSRLNRKPVSVDDAADAAANGAPQREDISPRQRRAPPPPVEEDNDATVEDHTDTHVDVGDAEVTADDDSGDDQPQTDAAPAPAAEVQTPAAGVAARVGRGRKTPATKKAAAVLPDDIADIDDEATARAMVKSIEAEIKDARAAYDTQVAALKKRFIQANEKLAEMLGG